MTISDLLSALAAEGRHATAGQVRNALLTGRAPVAPTDGAGNRQYGPEHLEAMRSYLASDRRPGKRARAERQALACANT